MTDVLIIGAGPAGLAAAITLRLEGLSVCIATREETARRKAGESLAGSAKRSLQRLGLLETFLADKHLPCYANSSSWGSAAVQHYSFLQSTEGHSWHIDRLLFEKRMLEKAIALGVEIHIQQQASLAAQEDGSWFYLSPAGETLIHARVVMDASGRNSWVARTQGILRDESDRQVALAAFLKTDGQPLPDHSSLVEAVEDGWWYSALLPDAALACVFFTDADLCNKSELLTAGGWRKKLQAATHTAKRVEAQGYELEALPFFSAAGSSCLHPPAGKNWIAAGDAALCFDPLASHGISFALVSGIDAAKAIVRHFKGDAAAFPEYGKMIGEVYRLYEGERLRHYHSEKRWPGAEYWKRRSAIVQAS